MSFLPRSLVSGASADPNSFHQLFRFLNDFDSYNQASTTKKDAHQDQIIRTFSPKFDVVETIENYELHGELPGVDISEVDIEFTDGQTLVIRGRSERTSANSASYFSKPIDGRKVSGNVTVRDPGGYQPSVEDEDEDLEKKLDNASNIGNNTIATQSKDTVQQRQQQQQLLQQSHAKYWVSERSIGEFSRTFVFPTNVDDDAVTAFMNKGILSVVIPKSKKGKGRKIQISQAIASV